MVPLVAEIDLEMGVSEGVFEYTNARKWFSRRGLRGICHLEFWFPARGLFVPCCFRKGVLRGEEVIEAQVVELPPLWKGL